MVTMHFRPALLFFLLVIFFVCLSPVHAQVTDTPAPEITPYDLLNATNNLRLANGLPALIVSDIIMGVAQTTAETMAAGNMHGHIGDVRGRIAAAGYGIGDTVWATENFATGPMPLNSIIYMAWGDDLHMKPMADPNYCHVGAGVATASDGTVYYIVQAAYTSNTTCSSHKKTGTVQSGFTATPIISQYIFPVLIATPQADGSLLHIVQYGQTAWHIAEAYGVKFDDLINYNYYLTDENAEVYVGQHIYIPVDMMMATLPPENSPTPTGNISTAVATKTTAMRKATRQPTKKTTISPDAESSPTISATETPQPPDDPNRRIRRLIIYAIIGGALLVLFGFYTQYR